MPAHENVCLLQCNGEVFRYRVGRIRMQEEEENKRSLLIQMLVVEAYLSGSLPPIPPPPHTHTLSLSFFDFHQRAFTIPVSDPPEPHNVNRRARTARASSAAMVRMFMHRKVGSPVAI